MKRGQTAIYFSAIICIILFSFFSFSYLAYPFFNSDAALSVLMSYDYHLPKDLYCWGQDRGGTPEMMIAHFFISAFHSSPLVISSVIHFLLLTAGLFASFHFVRKPFNRFALAAMWFFPSYFFIENVLYQFGIQFSFFIMAMFFFSRFIHSEKRKGSWLSLSFLFLILNCWVLDLGLIQTGIFFIYVMLHLMQKKKLPGLLNEIPLGLFSIKNILISALWSVAGIYFIMFAKNNAAEYNSYHGYLVNDFSGFKNVMTVVLNSFGTVILFRGKPSESIYFYCSVIFIFALGIFTSRNKNKERGFFKSFFFWQAIISLALLMVIRQVELSAVPSRFFGGCYLSFAVWAMMKMDTLEKEIFQLKILQLMVVITTVVSSLYECYFPKKLPPMVTDFPKLNLMKPVGIIGSYWNSYVFSAIDPEHIKATSFEGGNVRSLELAQQTISQSNILLVQNEWLDHFPDSITQFGMRLIKKGEPFSIGIYYSWNEKNDVIACQYRKE